MKRRVGYLLLALTFLSFSGHNVSARRLKAKAVQEAHQLTFAEKIERAKQVFRELKKQAEDFFKNNDYSAATIGIVKETPFGKVGIACLIEKESMKIISRKNEST